MITTCRPQIDENPLGGGLSSATTTKHSREDTSDHAESKAFTTLQAKFARVGHTLNRTVNPDGTILYLAGKWGYLRKLKGLKAVAVFLAVIGG